MPHIITQWQSPEQQAGDVKIKPSKKTPRKKNINPTTPRGTLGGLSSTSTTSLPGTISGNRDDSLSFFTPRSIVPSVFDHSPRPSPSSSTSSVNPFIDAEHGLDAYFELEDTSKGALSSSKVTFPDRPVRMRSSYPSSRSALAAVDRVLVGLEDENWALHDALTLLKINLAKTEAALAEREASVKAQESAIEALQVAVSNCHRLHIMPAVPPPTPCKLQDARTTSLFSSFNMSADLSSASNPKRIAYHSLPPPAFKLCESASRHIENCTAHSHAHIRKSYNHFHPETAFLKQADNYNRPPTLDQERRNQPQATLLSPKAAPDVTKCALISGQMTLLDEKKRGCLSRFFS